MEAPLAILICCMHCSILPVEVLDIWPNAPCCECDAAEPVELLFEWKTKTHATKATISATTAIATATIAPLLTPLMTV